MSSKITYLLGAGASFGNEDRPVLPIVPTFIAAIRQLMHDIMSATPDPILNRKLLAGSNNITVEEFRKNFFRYCEDLCNTLDNYSSIDTYARFLYFAQPDKLPELKAFINLCFSYWRIFQGLDTRYDSLFSLLIKGEGNNPKLPNNINILSWNYDLQVETCLGRYLQISNLRQLNTCVRIYPSPGDDYSKAVSQFKLVKLNGSCETYHGASGLIKPDIQLDFSRVSSKDYPTKAEELLYVFQKYFEAIQYRSSETPFISYSWEKHGEREKLMKVAEEVSAATEILIIIGYSFPLVNRKVDQHLLNYMPNVRKIIIQSPEKTIKGVRDRCTSLLSSTSNRLLFGKNHQLLEERIISFDTVNEFFVPDEFF